MSKEKANEQDSEEKVIDIEDPQSQETQETDPLQEAEQKITELEDKYLRLNAEFDNYRKRVVKEKAELILNGGEKVLTDLLPVIDDLERARANVVKATEVEAVKEGILLIMEKFMTYLQKEGVTAIEAVGKDFNTDYHEAIAMVPGQPEEMKGKVIDCVQTGYMLNDKVIRHSKVAIAE